MITKNKLIIAFILLILVVLVSANVYITRSDLQIPKVPRWDSALADWNYRIGFKFYNNASSNYTDEPMSSQAFNFSNEMVKKGLNASLLDVNSLRVSKHNPLTGGVLDSNVSFQVVCS